MLLRNLLHRLFRNYIFANSRRLITISVLNRPFSLHNRLRHHKTHLHIIKLRLLLFNLRQIRIQLNNNNILFRRNHYPTHRFFRSNRFSRNVLALSTSPNYHFSNLPNLLYLLSRFHIFNLRQNIALIHKSYIRSNLVIHLPYLLLTNRRHIRLHSISNQNANRLRLLRSIAYNLRIDDIFNRYHDRLILLDRRLFRPIYHNNYPLPRVSVPLDPNDYLHLLNNRLITRLITLLARLHHLNFSPNSVVRYPPPTPLNKSRLLNHLLRHITRDSSINTLQALHYSPPSRRLTVSHNRRCVKIFVRSTLDNQRIQNRRYPNRRLQRHTTRIVKYLSMIRNYIQVQDSHIPHTKGRRSSQPVNISPARSLIRTRAFTRRPNPNRNSRRRYSHLLMTKARPSSTIRHTFLAIDAR